MRMRDILRSKGGQVFTVAPTCTIHQGMEAMVGRQVGCLVVKEADAVVGIITERDILEFAAENREQMDDVLIRDVMTKQVIIGVADDRVDSVMNLMTRERIRHLPVMDDDRLVGLVSIGDLVNAVRSEVELENRYMHDYIAGVVA